MGVGRRGGGVGTSAPGLGVPAQEAGGAAGATGVQSEGPSPGRGLWGSGPRGHGRSGEVPRAEPGGRAAPG